MTGTVRMRWHRLGLSRTLSKRLRSGRPLRQHRRRPDERRSRYLDPHQSIAARPAIFEERVRLGDWQGDLIVGPMSRSTVGTLVDPGSGFVQLVHLPDGHRAEQLLVALTARVQPMPQSLRRTSTSDQGSEMASHLRVALLFGEGVFFADAGAPWMRGTNENTDGLLRQYLPKGVNLGGLTASDLHMIEDKLEHRPRKRLNRATPAEVMAGSHW